MREGRFESDGVTDEVSIEAVDYLQARYDRAELWLNEGLARADGSSSMAEHLRVSIDLA